MQVKPQVVMLLLLTNTQLIFIYYVWMSVTEHTYKVVGCDVHFLILSFLVLGPLESGKRLWFVLPLLGWTLFCSLDWKSQWKAVLSSFCAPRCWECIEKIRVLALVWDLIWNKLLCWCEQYILNSIKQFWFEFFGPLCFLSSLVVGSNGKEEITCLTFLSIA